ncbi:MAG: hypothetical protein BWY15_01017 [Firmicutes bacterium ADurb.Bin193]|nr:MAG: hypothetical protein BWY15_01017 [Firmicutes bacterium ADurb.Bin193]
MANNKVNWMGNPVVGGSPSQQTTRNERPFQPFAYQTPQMAPSADTETDDGTLTQQGPPMITEPGYIPAYLARNIGKNVRAEFVIGPSYLDKTGRLIEVGINYFVLDDFNSRTQVMCDLYSVKFVTILP